MTGEVYLGLAAGFVLGTTTANIFGFRRDRHREFREFKRGYFLGHGGGLKPEPDLIVNVDFEEVERRVIAEMTQKEEASQQRSRENKFGTTIAK